MWRCGVAIAHCTVQYSTVVTSLTCIANRPKLFQCFSAHKGIQSPLGEPNGVCPYKIPSPVYSRELFMNNFFNLFLQT